MKSAVLSPRGVPGELGDLASRGRLIAGQRVSAHRRRRRVARHARRLVSRLTWILALVAVVGAGALGTSWLLRSPRFAVASVDVTGQSRLTREEIAAAADVAPGTNIFTLDTRAVVARVEALPLIRRAEVIKSLPNHVALVVEERRPFTLVHAGKLHWIDDGGMDLGPESRAVTLTAPVLSGLGADELGRSESDPSERAAQGVSLLRLLRRFDASLFRQISEIDMSRPEGPVLYTVDGVEVRIGNEDWEARIGRLQGVLAQLGASGETPASIDLRFRDQVVLKTALK